MAQSSVDHSGAGAKHAPVDAVEGVASHSGADASGGGPMDVSGSMFLFTVVTFAIVAVTLAKLVWRPMLDALDKREQYLRQSLDDADKIELEMDALDETRKKILAEADDRGREILSRARKAGVEAERVIKDKAKEQSAIVLENAHREIKAAGEKARAELRRESVDTAIALAGKLLRENLDDEKNRRLTDQLIDRL